ncbi:hypothetical protein [Vibrio parahaemolyticus]|uniref:hypothetical protein n=1 Tax=Vibrio parahaemolyticus TaxID=670 RepID=UPI003D814BF5
MSTDTELQTLVMQARNYESFINSKIAEVTSFRREYLDELLRTAKIQFPEMRDYELDGRMVTPPQVQLFQNVLDTLIAKMGFTITEHQDELTSVRALRRRLNPDRCEPIPDFVCPKCQTESWSPFDAQQGYCNQCKEFTGK